MKKLLLALLITYIFSPFTVAQDTVLDVFKDQVDAFNKADVNRLTDNVSEDFKYFYFTSDELYLEVEGKAKFKESMKMYFNRGKKVHSKIEDYIVHGNRISFREVVSHKNDLGETISSSALGIYEIKDGKIYRSWYYIE